jgi:hypothetical protein
VSGATAYRIGREVFGPEVPDAVIEWALWEHTGYPSFFDGDPEEVLRAQLISFRDGRVSGEPLGSAD